MFYELRDCINCTKKYAAKSGNAKYCTKCRKRIPNKRWREKNKDRYTKSIFLSNMFGYLCRGVINITDVRKVLRRFNKEKEVKK